MKGKMMSKIVEMQHIMRVEQTGAHKRAPAVVVTCLVEGGPSFIAINLKSPPGQFSAAQSREMAAALLEGADILDAKDCQPEGMAKRYRYLGPCLTPDEAVTALPREVQLKAALREMVYEATHLSPQADDGSHWAKISKRTLDKARAALKDEPFP